MAVGVGGERDRTLGAIRGTILPFFHVVSPLFLVRRARGKNGLLVLAWVGGSRACVLFCRVGILLTEVGRGVGGGEWSTGAIGDIWGGDNVVLDFVDHPSLPLVPVITSTTAVLLARVVLPVTTPAR